MEFSKFEIISPDVGVYLFYAGRDRKYLELSRADNKVFLDLPGFEAGQDTFASDESIVQSLHRADAAKRHSKDRINNPRPAAASSYPQAFPSTDGRIDRSFLADFSNIKTMFVDMKVGDLVIMTQTDHYAPLLIGMVTSKWSDDDTFLLPKEEYTTPFRRVRWLSHGLTRRDFPALVARRLQNRKAITKVDPEVYEDIFRLVHRSYIWGNTSKIDIFAPGYSSHDPTATYEASFIIKYAIALYGAALADELDNFHALSVDDAAREYFDPVLALQVAQTFGSPGGYIVRLIGGGALVVAAIVALAASDESKSVDVVRQEISQSLPDKQTLQGIDGGEQIANLDDLIRAGSADEIRKRYGREAKSKLGLTLEGKLPPEVTVRNSDKTP